MQIRPFRSWLTVCLVCLCASIACAQEAIDNTSIPPARTKYLGRTIAQTMSFHGAPWLVRDNRDDEERTSEVLKQLELKPGMVVCDLGCGNGYYTLQMAPQVAPEGKVLAVDIQTEMLHLLELRSETLGIDNVEAVLGTLVDPQDYGPQLGIGQVGQAPDAAHLVGGPGQIRSAIHQCAIQIEQYGPHVTTVHNAGFRQAIM